ncbi:MAG: hypothetical protein MUF14_10205, partial [Hyphomonadaceae bacterium]|nr:hypothetical protein [Hyphomonadaceae bacterium]
MAGLILASGLTSLIYGVFFVTRQVSALRTVVKTASVVFLLLLVIVGVSGAAFSLLYLALAASALGDWLLAGEGERR